MELKHTQVQVRSISFKLMTYTHSLELCARMNFETENLDFIDDISCDDILYDLGACEGRFSLYAAKKGVKVISFEPEEKNFKVLLQNIALNDFQPNQIEAINAGVGAKTAAAVLNIGQPWEGGHQKVVKHNLVRNDLDFDFKEKQTIQLIAIDQFLEEEKGPFPDYLKIDIDGSELPFLEGAKKTLNNSNLKGIIFELSELDSGFTKIIDILKSYGFIERKRFPVPNEPKLYNIIFYKSNQ
ncbi:FkbM family methyltransferase [Crocinitomicaceae bacterium]|nr:FkbM family methyltransferase [Crocinitomicaceae bacterium]